MFSLVTILSLSVLHSAIIKAPFVESSWFTTWLRTCHPSFPACAFSFAANQCTSPFAIHFHRLIGLMILEVHSYQQLQMSYW